MNKWFETLTEQIAAVQDETQASEILSGLTMQSGFKLFAYVSLSAATQKVITNYAAEWVAQYNRMTYIRIDPVMVGLRKKTEAFRWIYPLETSRRRGRKYFHEAAAQGIRSGITVPINAGHGNVAMLTLSGDDPDLMQSKSIHPAIAAAAVAQAHCHLDHLSITPTLLVPASISAKQLLCLRWNAEGKTARDIAVLTNDSYANVRYHLTGAKQALGAVTLSQAIKIATSLRLL